MPLVFGRIKMDHINQYEALSHPNFPSLPPATFSAVQQATDYGVFVQYNNVLSWSPSLSSNVIGMLVARNGVLLANLTGVFLDIRIPM